MSKRVWTFTEWNGKEWIQYTEPMPWYWRLRYWVRDSIWKKVKRW